MCTANTLPYFPLHDVSSSSVPNIDAFVAAIVAAVQLRCAIISFLYCGGAIIDDIRAATATDTTLQQVLRHYQTGWPADIRTLSPNAL